MKRKMDDLYHVEENNTWLMTLGDMTTLLLTFFVFLIGISVFVTDQEYSRFWKTFDARQGRVKARTQSNRFALIPGLKMPVLSQEAGEILDEMTDFLEKGEYKGIDLFYDETKVSLRVSEMLGFPPGQAELSPALQKLLVEVVPMVKDSPFYLKIEGHTDNQASTRITHIDLSLQRALVVARFLIKNGLPSEKVAVAGYGATRPLSTDDTDEARALNRRVDVNLIFQHAR
jgi:chemotaxis protein MotB